MATRKSASTKVTKADVDAAFSIIDRNRQFPVTEEHVKIAVDVINRDYWDDVRWLKEDLERAVRDGEIADEDALQERIHEAVDGSQRVIYTFRAKLGLLVTNNAEAYQEAGIEFSDGIDWSVMMFYAMGADLRAMLPEFDFDS